jgi:branched-chain amino acid transport system permease protein
MKSRFVKENLPYIRILVFGAAICILPFVLSTYYTHIAVLALIWAFLAVAWNIIGGYAGQHSLGHGLYMGIGAYTVAYLLNHGNMSPWLSLFIAIAISGLVAWFIGYITFRYSIKGAYFALVTIALTEAAVYIVSNIQPLGGAGGIEMNLHYGIGFLQFGGTGREISYFLFGTALLVGILLLVQWYKGRRFFYQLIAVRENEDAAEALGVDTVKAKIKANVMSGILCAVGGIFYVQYFLYVYPRSVFGETVSVQILLFAIIGGLGTVWGPVVGAAILVPVVEITRSQLGSAFQGADLLIYGFVMVGTMLFMPFGIMGVYEKVKNRLFRRRPPQAKIEKVVESGEAA